MAKSFYIFLILLFCFGFNQQLSAQTWIRALQGNLDNLNFFTVKKDFYKYWEEKERLEKEVDKDHDEKEFKKDEEEDEEREEGEEEEEGILGQFKRFERFWESRINPDGSFPKQINIGEERKKYITQQSSSSRISGNQNANWKPILSPTSKGVGRIDCIAINPVDPNIIWAGSPTGGLWKTTNGGQTWTTNTDALPNIGISDIVIDPTNPNIMYIATGDRDSYFLNTSGVLKSSDGGNTWQQTGLNTTLFPFNYNNQKIYRLLINPNNTQILYAATTSGVWQTTNGGISWSNILADLKVRDLALQPNNPATVYAACWSYTESEFSIRKSINSGASFTKITTGLPSGTIVNSRLATTPADPNYLYLILVDENSSYKGLYLSTNAGDSFNLQSNSPNILGYPGSNCWTPTPGSGQGFYDLALCVSPKNKNIVFVGGIYVWKSIDAGVNWSNSDCYTFEYHWDQHYLLPSTFNENKIYAGNDGGIYELLFDSNSFAWKNITNNIQTTQFYGFGNSQTNPSKLSGGTQDNGTQFYDNNVWKKITDGDILDVQFDYSDESVFYVLGNSGSTNSVSRFENNGATSKHLFYNNSDLVMDPVNPEILYYYKNAFYRSIDRGDNWVKISNDNINNNQAQKLKFAGNNKDLIFYMDYPDPLTIKKFDIKTAKVTSIPNSIYGRIYDFAVSSTDINNMWMSCGGKIYKTINGGNSWSDISGSLPNSLAKVIVYENGSDDGIYIVTDLGIFYRNAAMSDWIPWMDGLPNVIITDLDIQYGAGKIRASSFGRGIWEGLVYRAMPIAKFSSSAKINCPGTPINFFDSSLNRPVTWQWSFPGGVPSSSTLKNPSVTYSSPGTYTVQLTVSNLAGTNTVTRSDYININSSVIPQQPGMIEGSNSVCQGGTQTFSVIPSAVATSYTWTLPSGWTGSSTTNSITTTVGTANGTISVKANNACGSSSSQILPVSTYAGSPPSIPGLISGSTSLCETMEPTYSISAVANATSYTWTLPSGLLGRSTTNSIDTYAGSLTGGNISVKANNGCGSSIERLLMVNINPLAKTDDYFIHGNSTVCAGSIQVYKVKPVQNTGSYSWGIPPGWTYIGSNKLDSIKVIVGLSPGIISAESSNSCSGIVFKPFAVTVTPAPANDIPISGNNSVCVGSSQTYSISPVSGITSYTWTLPSDWTGNSTTNSISATVGASSGAISVKANNATCSSNEQTLTVTVNNSSLPQPSAINGNTSVCQGSSQTYSISPVTGATSYTWTLPFGWTGNSTTNSISATVGASSGTISVKAINACSSSSNQDLTISVNSSPQQPGVISGNNSACQGSSQTYSISPVAGVTSYTWTLPSDWTGNSTTNSISATVGASSGAISVKANGSICSSPNQNLAISVNPSLTQPGTIIGNTSVCQGSSQTYSISPVTGATSYTWTLPSGWTGSSTTNSINITVGSFGGTISVKANNSCYSSSNQNLAISVNPLPVQPETISGNNSVCQGSSQTYSISPVAGATSYTWTLPIGWKGNSTTNSINTTVSALSGAISVKANNSCGSSSNQNLAISVNPSLAQLGAINGYTFVCQGSSQTYSISPVTGATSYTWTLPSGWTGNSTTNSISATVGASSGKISVKANNDCSSTMDRDFTISVYSSPPQPGVISGNNSVCQGSSQTYSISPVAGAISYTWTLPFGWRGSSTTNSISTIVGVSSGTISVKANSSNCSSPNQNLTITVNPLPEGPGSIIGNNSVCLGSSQIYSINPVTGATSYTWTLPSGWTGNSSTNSISTTVVASSGTISVKANNSCGSSSDRILIIKVDSIPDRPDTIFGNNLVCSGSTQTYYYNQVEGATGGGWMIPNAFTIKTFNSNPITLLIGTKSDSIYAFVNTNCGTRGYKTIYIKVNNPLTQPGIINGSNVVCQGSSQTYSISPVADAESYTWTLPSGWTGSSTTNSITTTAGVSGGTISVRANNACGSTNDQNLVISVIPSSIAQPEIIIGNNNNICQGSSQTYSISEVFGATSYTWALPSGWTGSSTTTSINTIVGASSGTVSVKANNSNCSGPNQNLAIIVNPLPVQPETINGNNSICQGSSQTYSISPVTGATSYTWTLPSGWTGNSTTNSISTTVGASSGTISVKANNSCGSGTAQSLAVTVNSIPTQPTTISGNNSFCEGSSQTYSISAVTGATSYTWTLPPGWTGNSNTSSITTTAGSSAGTISVKANNSCGSSTEQTLAVTVNSLPTQPSTITGNNNVLLAQESDYSISPLANATSYYWQLNDVGIFRSGQHTTSSKIYWTTAGNFTLSVNGINSCGEGPKQTMNVTVSVGTGIVNPDNQFQIKVFPNPSSGEFYLTAKGLINKQIRIDIFNNLGQSIYQTKQRVPLNDYYKVIDLKKMADGIYNVRIFVDNKYYLRKIAKLN